MGFFDFLFRRKKAVAAPPLSQDSPDRTMFGISTASAPPSSDATQVVSARPRPDQEATQVIAARPPAPPKPRARLTRKNGAGGPWELMPREYEIGRASAVDLVIADPSISSHHAKLVPLGEGFAIRDLGSTNGTKVNGQPISGDRALRGGETITLGEVVLAYERL